MNWLSPISSIIDGVSDYIGRKQEIKKAKVEGEIAVIKAEANAKIAVSEAQIEMAKKGQIQDYDLDKQSVKDMKDSWKDEYVLLIHSTPLILSFVPSTQPYIERGFQIIDTTIPAWFVWLYIGMVVVIFGLRGLLKFYLKMIGGKMSLGK